MAWDKFDQERATNEGGGTHADQTAKYGGHEQPAPNTAEATQWHNEALNQARQKLGSNASHSAVLQEAARIQQSGRK